jgi:hypothetical protein
MVAPAGAFLEMATDKQASRRNERQRAQVPLEPAQGLLQHGIGELVRCREETCGEISSLAEQLVNLP